MIAQLKKETGIKQSLFTPYSFEDQAWSNKKDPNHLTFHYLANHCVLVGECYWVRDKHTDHWRKVPKTGLASKLLNERGGLRELSGFHVVITLVEIKSFLATGIVTFDAVTCAPGAGDFLIFQHEKRLNLYRDQRLEGDSGDINEAEEFLKILRNSLCAEPDELDLHGMLSEIAGKKMSAFRWMMHWLAARYQLPGYAPQTNLWLIGPVRGVGKGTLVSAMKTILGGQAVGKANQLDIQKGWTNSVFGHELVEWDEFKCPGGWLETANLIKQMTGNETIQVNGRNVGGTTHPAIAMHIFTTNDEKPIRVDKHDRQNTFIATTKDKAWANRAKALSNKPGSSVTLNF